MKEVARVIMDTVNLCGKMLKAALDIFIYILAVLLLIGIIADVREYGLDVVDVWRKEFGVRNLDVVVGNANADKGMVKVADILVDSKIANEVAEIMWKNDIADIEDNKLLVLEYVLEKELLSALRYWDEETEEMLMDRLKIQLNRARRKYMNEKYGLSFDEDYDAKIKDMNELIKWKIKEKMIQARAK